MVRPKPSGLASQPGPGPLASVRQVSEEGDGPEGWHFEVEETSNGVWRVTGTDRLGRSVQSRDTDHDALMRKCRAWAREMTDRR